MKKLVIGIMAIMFFGGVAGISTTQAAFTCSGVPQVAMNLGGSMLINNGYGWHVICSPATTLNNIPPENCRELHKEFMLAEALNKTVTFYYDYNNTTRKTCADLGSWVSPDPFPYFVTF